MKKEKEKGKRKTEAPSPAQALIQRTFNIQGARVAPEGIVLLIGIFVSVRPQDA